MLHEKHVIFQADMLVNSVAGDSDELEDCGIISEAFCKAGGDAVANSFKQGGPLDIGETRAYDGDQGQLQCKVVAHISIGNWEGRKSTQVYMQNENLTLKQMCTILNCYYLETVFKLWKIYMCPVLQILIMSVTGIGLSLFSSYLHWFVPFSVAHSF